MTKAQFIAIYNTLQTIGSMPVAGLSEVQASLNKDAYNQLWNLLTDNGKESLGSAAEKLGLELV